MSNRESTTTRHTIVNPNLNLAIERDQAWLQAQLDHLWLNHFYDVVKLNTVTIKWSRASRTRLGTITGKGGRQWRSNPEISEIKINALLKNPEIPNSVIWQTIAHEVAHYTHGFCSPHPKKFAHPHRGGVIEKELVARNLESVYNEAETWLKANWRNHVMSNLPAKPKRRSYGRKRILPFLSLVTPRTARRRRI